MRHTTNKRGFTLTEIMIVIAIIVILVSAVSAGIAIDLNRYKNHLASLTTDEGESAWEIAARSEVAGIFGAAASDNAIALASQSAAAESSIAAAGLASQSAAAVKASEAAVSASAAAISDAAASASAAAATTASASSAAATTVAAATTQSSSGGGSSASGSSVSVSSGWWNGTLSFDNPVESCIVVVPNGSSLSLNQWQYSCKDLGGGKYEIKYQGDGNGRTAQTSITVRLPDGGYIESFVSH